MRAFRHLLVSTATSNLADGLLKVGAPLLAVTMTRSPTLVSLVGMATTLPWLLLALHAGAIADRGDRRRIMMAAGLVRTATLGAATVLALCGWLSLPLLVAAVLLAGVSEVFADTSAQAVLPMTVPRERLTHANGQVVGVQTIGNDFVGAPLAGLLVALVPVAVIGAPALLYGLAALALVGMRGTYRPENPSTGPLRRDIASGLRYLREHRFLRTLAISAGLLNFANAAYFAVFILWAVGAGSRIGMEPAAYGLVMTTLAVGALVGSQVASRVAAALGDGRTLAAVWTLSSLLLLVPVLYPTPWALYVTGALLGVTGAAGNVIVISMRQRIIPEELLGRVNSAYRLIGMGGSPLGALAGGLVGEAYGLPAVFVSAVVVCLIAVALISPRLISRPLTCTTVVSGISGSR
ncbi:MFS transporter [Nonomuraea sp. NPDC050328]|uniref:MFS transporter n=1 Tax=Nonomuraea sp. NPDC050328 TaxID=3364361 RepID=UPI00378F8958